MYVRTYVRMYICMYGWLDVCMYVCKNNFNLSASNKNPCLGWLFMWKNLKLCVALHSASKSSSQTLPSRVSASAMLCASEREWWQRSCDLAQFQANQGPYQSSSSRRFSAEPWLPHNTSSGLEGNISFCRGITRNRIVSLTAIAAIFLQEGGQQHASSYCRHSSRKLVILYGRDGGWLYSK